ncbi:MAG: response regulator [Bacteroidetes bacterium]|nr:response regulator [Bacteroidota bacterium]
MSSDRLKRKLASIKVDTEEQGKILIVDDEVSIIDLLQTLLEDEGYQVLTAFNGKAALEIIRSQAPDLVISDVNMPLLDGLELCRLIKNDEQTRFIPVILITGRATSTDTIRGIEAGADEFIAKPFNALEMAPRVKSLLKVKKLNSRLENIDQIILAFSMAVEARDPYTRGHSERVGKYGMRLAAALGLDTAFQNMLFKGAILHDIGKIGIRDSILLKKDKLSFEEFQEIKKHPEIGIKICAPLKSSRSLLNIVLYHHERMDGGGYPYGLIAEEIPMEARMIGITDTFDALTSARPYRGALSTVDACNLMAEEIDTHFDEDLLPVFLDLARSGKLDPILHEAGHEAANSDIHTEISLDLIKGLDFFDGNLIG